jgi:penicillin amidase
MRTIRALVLVVGAALLPGCNPAGCFAPADLPRDKPLEVTSSSTAAPSSTVDVVLDELGIPHLYGENEVDLSYGLGFLHARDRLFQIFVYVHASQGRLTELLGEDLLPVDRQNRLLTWHLKEQEDAMSSRDRALVSAYADGLNDGAAQVGRSAEMALLGVDWEPVDVRAVLAILRLQQWSQAVGFAEEMTRWRLARALGIDDPRFRALWQDVVADGHPIVTTATHSGEPFAFGNDLDKVRYHRPSSSPSNAAAPSPLPVPSAARPAHGRSVVMGMLRGLKLDLGEQFARGGTGHSNSWAVDQDHNDSGAPTVFNDPHLAHSAPGVFYMVHLEGPDFTVAGGTFPGIPAVLIGHGRHIAWGVTNSYADTQDVVVLRPWAGNPDLYTLDGGPMSFTRHTEKFRLGKEDDAEVVTEDYADSVFGPVLPPRWGTFDEGESWNTDDERLVLQWTAYNFPHATSRLVSSFWDLARSTTIEAATAALQDFTAPAMSIAIAIAENDDGPSGIHYRLNGIVPVRGDEQRVDFPRLGVTRAGGFTGILPAAQKPQLDNPPEGFIVAANQRIVDNGSLSQRFVGYEGGHFYRSSRIHERLAQLLSAQKKPSPDDLMAIQQDVESIEARTLAPIYASHCPKGIKDRDADLVKRFCKAIADFDGVYSKDARATPFARVHQSFREILLRRHMSEDLMLEAVPESSTVLMANGLVQRAHAKELTDGDRALLDDPGTEKVEDFDDVFARATQEALDLVVQEAGSADSDWRWAKLHTLQFKGILARAPVVGGLFQTGEYEEGGARTAPRAESASPTNRLRVSSGAGLRHFAVMTPSPTVKMINDTGQSGHFGHRHLEDQYPLWTKGETRVLKRAQEDVAEKNDGLLRLLPAP